MSNASVDADLAPLTVHRVGRVATVTLRRPGRANALSETLIEALPGTLASVAAEPEIGVVTITGEGRVFCAGGDIGHRLFKLDDPTERAPLIEAAYRITETILDLPVPVVAAVNGPCAGAAVAIVAAADIRVAGRSARFSLDFVNLGLLPDMGICHLLPRDVGVARALELALLGERITAEEAARLGIIGRVVPDESLLSVARELADRLADIPPQALLAIRRAVRELPALPRDDAFHREAEAMNRLIGSAEAQDRLARFHERQR